MKKIAVSYLLLSFFLLFFSQNLSSYSIEQRTQSLIQTLIHIIQQNTTFQLHEHTTKEPIQKAIKQNQILYLTNIDIETNQEKQLIQPENPFIAVIGASATGPAGVMVGAAIVTGWIIKETVQFVKKKTNNRHPKTLKTIIKITIMATKNPMMMMMIKTKISKIHAIMTKNIPTARMKKIPNIMQTVKNPLANLHAMAKRRLMNQ